MDLRTKLCFALSRRMIAPPAKRVADEEAYGDWRDDSLTQSWGAFSDTDITGKDVLDFGCGDGALSFYLAAEKHPRLIEGVDIIEEGIDRAKQRLKEMDLPEGVQACFQLGSTDGLPVADQSFDTLLAFDCMEHVMSPGPILEEWYRVLRPGGRCLIEWFPYKGPWGPHMDSLVPVPWAHVLFGERAMLRTAEKIYRLPEYVPNHWDLDDEGNKIPDKWEGLTSFDELGFLNKLDVSGFRELANNAGFEIVREEPHSFSSSKWREMLGKLLMSTPLIGEYFMSYIIIELRRPS